MGDGHRGIKCKEETKQKIKKAHIGKKLSEETKQKMRKPKSEDHKINLRLAHLGINMGKKMSDSAKENMRKGWIKRKLNKIVS